MTHPNHGPGLFERLFGRRDRDHLDGVWPVSQDTRPAANGSPPPLALSEPNRKVLLPSIDPEFSFGLSLVVDYRIAPSDNGAPPANPLRAAIAGIDVRAREVTTRFPITASDQMWSQLEAALSQPQRVPSTPIVAWAHCADVKFDQAAMDLVARREQAKRDARVRAWQREEEHDRIAILAELILDPRKATAWWLLHNTDRVDDITQAAQRFTDVRSILERSAESERQAEPGAELAALVAEFWSRADQPAREHLLRDARRLFNEYGHDELAARGNRLLESLVTDAASGRALKTGDRERPGDER